MCATARFVELPRDSATGVDFYIHNGVICLEFGGDQTAFTYPRPGRNGWHDFSRSYKKSNLKEIKSKEMVNDLNSHVAGMNVESSVILNSDKIALVFFEVVRNRLQHINSWATIAPKLGTNFQLVNRFGIEVYRKVQEGDFVRMNDVAHNRANGKIEWIRIHSLESSGDSEMAENFSFMVQPSSNPLNNKFRHEPLEEFKRAIGGFSLARAHAKVTAAVSVKRNVEEKSETDSDERAPVPCRSPFLLFNNLSWKALTDGLISR